MEYIPVHYDTKEDAEAAQLECWYARRACSEVFRVNGQWTLYLIGKRA